MSASTSEVIEFIDDLLGDYALPDFAPNGLQVPGPDKVQRVATGVSAHGPLIDAAAEAKADLLLVHHGLFWKGQPLEITPIQRRRLAPLFEYRIALAAYHLPLDAHPAHGNNALLANALRVEQQSPFGSFEGGHLGVQGVFPGGISAAELSDRVRTATGGREPLVISPDPDAPIGSIGIVSGAASDYMLEAIDLGLDAFLTGEPSERAFGNALDGPITYVAAGHHATETFGVKRLGELLAQRFGIEHIALDIDNPI